MFFTYVLWSSEHSPGEPTVFRTCVLKKAWRYTTSKKIYLYPETALIHL